MSILRERVFAAALVTGLVVCSSVASAKEGCSGRGAVIGGASNAPAPDWNGAPIAHLRLALGWFHPQHLKLALGQKVRLVFDNGDGVTHDFITSFFATVQQVPGCRPGGARVILQPADTIEYDIVPLRAGLYPVQSFMLSQPGQVPPATIEVR